MGFKGVRVFRISFWIFVLTGVISLLTGRTFPWQQPIGSLFNSFVWAAFLVLVVAVLLSKSVRAHLSSLSTSRLVLNIIFATLILAMFIVAVYAGLPIQ